MAEGLVRGAVGELAMFWRREATHHALRPLVHDLDEAEFEPGTEPFFGDVGAVAGLHPTDALGDVENCGFALRTGGQPVVSAG